MLATQKRRVSRGDSSMTETTKPINAAPTANAVSGKPNFFDTLFLIFLTLILACVAWVGMLSYEEGTRNKVTVENGEAWVKWMKEHSEARMSENFHIESCGYSAEQRRRWGDCYSEIMEKVKELNSLSNPFSKGPVQFVAKCVAKDNSTVGGIFLEKIVPTPAGSAIPAVASQLVDIDAIDTKIALRLTVCDKGGYPIKVDEFEF
jgi:hypothetical protein